MKPARLLILVAGAGALWFASQYLPGLPAEAEPSSDVAARIIAATSDSAALPAVIQLATAQAEATARARVAEIAETKTAADMRVIATIDGQALARQEIEISAAQARAAYTATLLAVQLQVEITRIAQQATAAPIATATAQALDRAASVQAQSARNIAGWVNTGLAVIVASVICAAVWIVAQAGRRALMDAADVRRAFAKLDLEQARVRDGLYYPPEGGPPVKLTGSLDEKKIERQNTERAAEWRQAVLRFCEFGAIIGSLSQNKMREAGVMEVAAWKILVGYLRDTCGILQNRKGSQTDYAPGWSRDAVRAAVADGSLPAFPSDGQGNVLPAPDVRSPLAEPSSPSEPAEA